MSSRELLFAVLTFVAVGLVVAGVMLVSVEAGLVSAGVLLAGWSWLLLAETDA